jgi:hypothetical protein
MKICEVYRKKGKQSKQNYFSKKQIIDFPSLQKTFTIMSFLH